MAEKRSTKDKNPEVKPPKETKTEKPKEKTGKKGLIFGLIGAAVLTLAAVGYFVLRPKATPDDPKAKLTYSRSFFISDGGKYTLWNAEGKRLTEDTYEYKSDFVAGYAYVKKDGQVGVIREDGVITVPFGKYGTIEAKGGLYLAQDGNTKEYHVITGAGKDIFFGPEVSVRSAGYSNAFALVETSGTYDLFTYAGTHLGTFPKVEGAEEAEIAGSSDFGSFYYNNSNLIFDVRDGRVLASIEGSRYTFEDVADNRSQILLQNEDNETDYKLIANGQVISLNECKYYAFTILDYLIGYESYSEIAILNPDFTVAERVSSYLALKDNKNYAVKNDDGNVVIYRNGAIVKTFDQEADLESGVLYEDLYAIENNGKVMFYNLDGNVAINHEFAAVWSLFDEFHHATVADAEDEYYLIDAKGNRLTEGTYKRIYTEDGGYELKDSEGRYAIANEKGELITEAKYDSLYYRSAAIDRNIWTGKNAYEDYDVIDVANKKVLLEHVNVVSFYTNYFSVKNADGKYEYYTYDGLKFYTSEN